MVSLSPCVGNDLGRTSSALTPELPLLPPPNSTRWCYGVTCIRTAKISNSPEQAGSSVVPSGTSLSTVPGPRLLQGYLATPKNLLGSILVVDGCWMISHAGARVGALTLRGVLHRGEPQGPGRPGPITHLCSRLHHGMAFLGRSLHLCCSVELQGGRRGLKWGDW